MAIVICPGFHPPQLTIDFLQGLGRDAAQVIIYPAERLPPYSSLHLLTFLRQQFAAKTSDPSNQKPPLLFIGFSAGVVAAIGAAQSWQATGGAVKALIAIDGWGVPLGGNLPIHRMSHDAFTHWSSALLGGDGEGFYAAPSVSHLDLWRSPQQVRGYCVSSALRHLGAFSESVILRGQITAATLLNHWLDRYGEGKIT